MLPPLHIPPPLNPKNAHKRNHILFEVREDQGWQKIGSWLWEDQPSPTHSSTPIWLRHNWLSFNPYMSEHTRNFHINAIPSAQKISMCRWQNLSSLWPPLIIFWWKPLANLGCFLNCAMPWIFYALSSIYFGNYVKIEKKFRYYRDTKAWNMLMRSTWTVCDCIILVAERPSLLFNAFYLCDPCVELNTLVCSV